MPVATQVAVKWPSWLFNKNTGLCWNRKMMYRVWRYLGYRFESKNFHLQDFHLLWSDFPNRSISFLIGNSTHAVLQPYCVNTIVWAIPISLATTFGISVDFFSSGYWDVSLPRVAFLSDTADCSAVGYPIRKSPDQRLFAPPRRLTQLTTSFIDSLSQGIHHMHLLAWSHYLISFLPKR